MDKSYPEIFTGIMVLVLFLLISARQENFVDPVFKKAWKFLFNKKAYFQQLEDERKAKEAWEKIEKAHKENASVDQKTSRGFLASAIIFLVRFFIYLAIAGIVTILILIVGWAIGWQSLLIVLGVVFLIFLLYLFLHLLKKIS